MIGIGIDTGGTYTDAVIYDTAASQVLAKCKRLTTKEDLAVGIGNALDALPEELLHKAEHVSLSTTLATNACVEGKGGRAKLIIVGSTPEILKRIDAPRKYGLPLEDTLAIDYKGSYDGTDVDEPDWDAICNENAEFFADADAFGLAGLYALNNGSIIERHGAEYLEKRYGVPVVQATSVAASLNVMERGATALLNARLLPLIHRFMEAVKRALANHGLDLPIMIVRSDGSLMSQELAKVRPVTTILSGPAASVSGAGSITREPESLVIDIGGTTSDISIVTADHPLMTDGISIGGWKTQVKGVFIDTIGLGGDSAVRYSVKGGLELLPRRVQPMCIAASRWPGIIENLERVVARSHPSRYPLYEHLYIANEPKDLSHYTDAEKRLLETLANGPVGLYDDRIDVYHLASDRLEDEGVVMRCGMTPTDAMHLKGDFDTFDRRASDLTAQAMLTNIPHDAYAPLEDQVAMVADTVYELAKRRLYNQIVRVLLQNRYPHLLENGLGDQLQLLIDDAWERARDGRPASTFDVDFTTSAALVGIGAPTHIFLPDVAKALGTRCVIPQDAEVANAIGAIHAEIAVDERAWINPNRGPDGVIESYQVHSVDLNEQVDDMFDAMALAQTEVVRVGLAEARRRGAIGDLFYKVEASEQNSVSGEGVALILSWSYDVKVRTSEFEGCLRADVC